tara:strand:- start:2777 stop:2971 length:195 start_codon:yes stop_codon:yes gene_type:complete
MKTHELKNEITNKGMLGFDIENFKGELDFFEIGFMNDKFFVFKNGELIQTTKIISKQIQEIINN